MAFNNPLLLKKIGEHYAPVHVLLDVLGRRVNTANFKWSVCQKNERSERSTPVPTSPLTEDWNQVTRKKKVTQESPTTAQVQVQFRYHLPPSGVIF